MTVDLMRQLDASPVGVLCTLRLAFTGLDVMLRNTCPACS